VAAGGGSRRSNETSRGKKIVRVLLSPSNFSMFSLFFFFFSFFSLCFCFCFFFCFLLFSLFFLFSVFPCFSFPSFLFCFGLFPLSFSSVFLPLLWFSLSGPPFFLFLSRPLVFIRGKRGRESYYPCPVMAQR
jgi:hypothetical protein